jgi:transposase-like protein
MGLNKIIRLIEESDKNIYQIAKEAGVDYSLVHRILHNKTKNTIRLDTAFKIVDAL